MNRLVILAPNWLGDAVMALPAIADVHRASPDTIITVAARPAMAPLFQLVPSVQDVVVLESATRSPGGSRDAANPPRGSSRAFNTGSFDAALLLPNSFHSALLVRRAGIRERWGYRTQWRGPLLTRAIDCAPAGLHQVEYYQQLVHALGFPNGPIEPRIDLPANATAAGADALAGAGWDRRSALVALAPGAAYGSAKRWPPHYFAELARALASDGVAVAMVGSAADAPAGREIEACPGADRILNLIGATDLVTLAGVLANCRALVTNDSGAMHVAAALGVRVTAVFGPTDERVTGPRGEIRVASRGRPPDRAAMTHAVMIHPVWCRPCLLRECPLEHACMQGVQPDAVRAEARRTL